MISFKLKDKRQRDSKSSACILDESSQSVSSVEWISSTDDIKLSDDSNIVIPLQEGKRLKSGKWREKKILFTSEKALEPCEYQSKTYGLLKPVNIKEQVSVNESLCISIGDDKPTVPPNMDDYKEIPVSRYGEALLRGMGWKEDSNQSTVSNIHSNQERLGLGLKEKKSKDAQKQV
jgi:hypothetical protein